MHTNPVIKKLGLSDHERVVIIHSDDIGMCQATLAAFADLWDFGLISSGATMVPCPWFPAAAAFCAGRPAVDMGVHLTLTSEWETYRWRAVSAQGSEAGLLDSAGYLHRQTADVQTHADPAAVQVEIQAQVQRAMQAGIDVTHIDTHMGAVAHPKFIRSYLQLAIEQRLPVMIPRLDEAGFRQAGMDAEGAAFATRFILEVEAMNIPMLDHLVGLPLDQPANRIEQAKRALAGLPIGLTHFIIHPAADTPELRAIAPDWPSRVADYQAFSSEELCAFVKEAGLTVIGYRALRDLIRS